MCVFSFFAVCSFEGPRTKFLHDKSLAEHKHAEELRGDSEHFTGRTLTWDDYIEKNSLDDQLNQNTWFKKSYYTVHPTSSLQPEAIIRCRYNKKIALCFIGHVQCYFEHDLYTHQQLHS